MKKILILLLFAPFFVNGQHIKGTVNLDAAATAEVSIGFIVFN